MSYQQVLKTLKKRGERTSMSVYINSKGFEKLMKVARMEGISVSRAAELLIRLALQEKGQA